MRDASSWIRVVCVVGCVAAGAAFGQKAGAGVDWSHPETIDPLDEGIGDFLDVDLGTLRKKAFEAYQAKDYEGAARYYLAFLRYDIGDSSSIYNLACCYGLLGKAELAAKYLERAVKAGFDDVEHIKRDPDFDKVRGSEAFDAAVKRVEKAAQEKAEGLGKLLYLYDAGFLQCRVQLPEGFDAKKEYPLVIGLHGVGDNPDRFIRLWDKFAKRDFIYAVPQAPYPFLVGKGIGYSWHLRVPHDDPVGGHSWQMSERFVSGIAGQLKMGYTIGDVYLLRFSQGAALAYEAGLTSPDVFTGIICFGGWLKAEQFSKEQIEKAKHLRVFIAHGTQDTSVPYKAGVAARDALKQAGYEVTFFEFEGGHLVPEEVLREAEEWMRGKNGKPAEKSSVRTIHVFVALCDNKHQGIVPVRAALGNGQDARNNLYWGAMYGLKTYFSKSPDWELMATVKGPKAAVLERCVFKHKTADVYLVADAYDGREIKQTVVDFLTAAAGGDKDSVSVGHNSEKLAFGTGGGAHLVAYVGHNGLMDFTLETYPEATDDVSRDAIVLGCRSKPYFSKPLHDAGANALLLTTGLMAPEAYTLKSAIDGWIRDESSEEIRLRAAKAYHEYQDCGLAAAKRLFAVGR